MNSRPGKLLRLYVNEHDKYEGRPQYEAIVARCRELSLAGPLLLSCEPNF